MRTDYTIKTHKTFFRTADSVVTETEKAGFKVLYIHDVQQTLSNKGFSIEPLKIIEICNARNAYAVIQKDILLSLFLPCKINVYVKDNQTYISALKPEIIQSVVPDADIKEVIQSVSEAIIAIVNNAG